MRSQVSDLRDFLNDAKLSDVTFVVEGKAVGDLNGSLMRRS